jgi:hypothetical protein
MSSGTVSRLNHKSTAISSVVQPKDPQMHSSGWSFSRLALGTEAHRATIAARGINQVWKAARSLNGSSSTRQCRSSRDLQTDGYRLKTKERKNSCTTGPLSCKPMPSICRNAFLYREHARSSLQKMQASRALAPKVEKSRPAAIEFITCKQLTRKDCDEYH